ncbi:MULTISPECIES: NTP transferase domain-containing protein [Methanobacterium]|uniref:Acylneuraminate cytidylyltransferase n=1 Tax=Methanobacterium bryantii TaxID=2161 RepID=A0A2A2H0M4_METBR|nr:MULTISPECIES: NTP transferase domain-containing protein [Methanobacterium]OEC88671.1 acylneuraminate cytidylyltransferase [Methanobacterium sp. A39]PAV02932.1 acylneuraminate cytidylyltransferase [Methanobacterium bryantii]
MVTALIMAGGKGTRMKLDVEKPLVEVNGKPLVQYVVDALKNTDKISNILVATSKNTPRTESFLKEQGMDTIETPGDGYVQDLGFIISNFELDDILLTITADLPLVNSDIISHVLEEYEKSDKPAMSVLVPIHVFEEYGIKPTMRFENLIPSGLNVLRSINKAQDEKVLIIERIELALNINTYEDIKLLKNLLGDQDE